MVSARLSAYPIIRGHSLIITWGGGGVGKIEGGHNFLEYSCRGGHFIGIPVGVSFF